MDDEKFTLPEDGGTPVSEETIAKIKAHIDVDADVTVDLRQTEAALPEVQTEKKSTWRNFFEYLLIIVGAFLFSLIFTRFVAFRSVVDGESMMDNFKNNDNLICERVSYYFSDPKRYDVVVFKPYEGDNKTDFVKRVIGLPGETIWIKDNRIFIDGKALTDDIYGSTPTNYGGIADSPFTLGEDEYFLLGDNRSHSHDSRFSDVGPVKKKQIEGRALLRFWPLNQITFY